MKGIFLSLCFCWILFIISITAAPLYAEAPPSPETAGSLKEIPSYVHKKIYKKTWKKKEVDFSILSLCIGDVDGDGLNELISTDGSDLRIVQWKFGQFRPLQDSEKETTGRFFSFRLRFKESRNTPLEEINKLNKGMRYYNLWSADLDGDGRDEILFNGIRKRRLYSGVLEYRKGRFLQTIIGPGLYLKLFHDEEGRPILLGQPLFASKNQAYRYQWEGAALKKGAPLDLPEGATILELSSYRAEDTHEQGYLLYRNPGELLFLSSDFRELARIEDFSNPTQHHVRVRMTDDQGRTVKKRLKIPKRFLTGDFSGDGRDEILVLRKRPFLNFWGFRTILERRMAADFVLKGTSLLELWDTDPIFGEILDQAVGDVDNDGRKDLVLVTEKGLVPFRKGTELLIYELR